MHWFIGFLASQATVNMNAKKNGAYKMQTTCNLKSTKNFSNTRGSKVIFFVLNTMFCLLLHFMLLNPKKG